MRVHKTRWGLPLMAASLAAMSVLAGCGGDADNKPAASAGAGAASETPKASEPAKKADPVKLKLAMWEAKTDIEFWTEQVKEYTKLKPHVTVEVETIPDNSGQYMKVRLAANDLPDLFYLKPAHFQVYKNSLLPLDDLEATKTNLYPGKIDGKVLGNPLVSFSEYVYYHPGIFKEVGVEVPKTLDEFVTVMEKIKAHGKYIPIAIGGKEDWTFYPFSEFGPHILSGDVNYLAAIAKTPEPFAAGSTFDKVMQLLKTMSDKKLAGPDALGLGFDQSTKLFQSKQAAMIALGQWYYADHISKVGNDDDMGAFPLPWRASESEPLKAMTMTDQYLAINKNSKQAEEAKAFYNWVFSKDVYQKYIDKLQNSSTVKDVTVNLPFFNKSNKEFPFEPFMYEATDEAFAKVKGAAQFDEKKIAQEVYAGKPVADVLKKINESWKKAVESTK